MEFNQFIRKPFVVSAVEITEDNIEEIAALVGELKEHEGQPYIALDRKTIPNVRRAKLGWYLTSLGDNYRVYSPKVFNEQFTEHHPNTGYFFDEEGHHAPKRAVHDDSIPDGLTITVLDATPVEAGLKSSQDAAPIAMYVAPPLDPTK